MKRIKFLLPIAAMLWQSLAFSQSNPLLKYIPADASMVMHIDAKRLGSKIPEETFRQSFMYREMMKDPKAPFQFFKEPGKIGLDISSGIIMAFQYEKPEKMEEERFERSTPEFHIFIKLSDAALFTSKMQELMKGNEEEDKVQIEIYGTNRLVLSGGAMVAGWNNEVFVISNGYSNELRKVIREQFSSFGDSATPNRLDMERIKADLIKGQRNMAFDLLTPKPQGSIQSNPYFNEVMHREADIQLWTSGGGSPLTGKMVPFADLLNKLETVSGKNKTAIVNFENGKIVAQSSNVPEGIVADIYKKYPTSPQNMDLVKRLPAGTVLGLANFSFNQEMAGELLQRTGLLQLLDSFKTKIPFDLSLVPGTFKSNIMIAAVKTDPTTTTDEIVKKMDGVQLIIALPIADKARFQQLKPAVLSAWNSLNKNSEDEIVTMKQPKGLYAKHSDDMLVLSLSPTTAATYLASPGTGETPAVLQEYSKYPMVASINFRQILSSILNKKMEEQGKDGLLATMVGKFDQVLAYGGIYENGSINSMIEFRFSNQQENSFQQLFELITSVAENKEAMRRDEDWGDNSMDTVAVMDTTVMIIPDSAAMAVTNINIPVFKNKLVQEFADLYVDYVNDYSIAVRTHDENKFSLLSKKGQALAEKSTTVAPILADDPEESKKLADFLAEMSKRITSLTTVTLQDIKQEKEEVVPPPPPPKKPVKKTKGKN